MRPDDAAPGAEVTTAVSAHDRDCVAFAAVVSGFVDGELDASQAMDAERHLVRCAACRSLTDRVERVDLELRWLAERMTVFESGVAVFPAPLVNAVLDRTVRPGQRERRWRLVGSLGWATAAVVMVSWILTGQFGRLGGAGPAEIDVLSTSNPSHESGPADDGLASAHGTGNGSADASLVDRYRRGGLAQSPVELGARRHADRRSALPPAVRVLDHQLAWGERGWGDLAPGKCEKRCDEEMRTDVPESSGPRLADSDTIFAASLMLDRLARLDPTNVVELERIQYVIEYEGIIARLADARRRLDPDDRPLVTGAQCFLIRLLRGPVEESVIAEMQADLDRIELPSKLESLSDRLEMRRAF